MASTGGGFLLGFGLCLMLMSLLLGFIATEAYREFEKYASEIERLYYITHSSRYQSTLKALEELSGVAGGIRDALCHQLISWMGLCGVGEGLAETTSNAALQMKELQYTSERLYYTYKALPIVTYSLGGLVIIGLVLIIGGIILIIRARRREKNQVL